MSRCGSTVILKELNSFFVQNKQKLELDYPGLSFTVLQQKFEEYIVFNGNFNVHFLLKNFKNYLSTSFPLEYITHNAYFYESNFCVSPSVLIPRSESEIMIDETINFLLSKKIKNKKQNFSILEMGVGSGAILLSVLMHDKILKHQDQISFNKVIGSDISEEALSIFKKNIFSHKNKINPDHKIESIQSDLFNNIDSNINSLFDVILFNPPYIKRKMDYPNVHHNVSKWEPDIALFLNDNEYEKWFVKLFKNLSLYLKPSGLFIMEGHENHLQRLINVFKEVNNQQRWSIECLKDYTSRDRFLKVVYHG